MGFTVRGFHHGDFQRPDKIAMVWQSFNKMKRTHCKNGESEQILKACLQDLFLYEIKDRIGR
jgi:hypothetical protein